MKQTPSKAIDLPTPCNDMPNTLEHEETMTFKRGSSKRDPFLEIKYPIWRYKEKSCYGHYYRDLFEETKVKRGSIADITMFREEDVTETGLEMVETPCLVEQQKDHMVAMMQGLAYVSDLDLDSMADYKFRTVTLPPTHKKKLAIFDMDETLIHCLGSTKYGEKPKINDRGVLLTSENAHVTVDGMNYEGITDRHQYINIRPYAKQCMRELSKHYQIIVFTASDQTYADPILDYLDPEGIIEYRCYRPSCHATKDLVYLKDLRIFEQWSLDDMILIDNCSHSFAFQLDNGYPILSYYEDSDDRELVALTHYMLRIIDKGVTDVRPLLHDTFHLQTFMDQNLWAEMEGVVEYAVEEVEVDEYESM